MTFVLACSLGTYVISWLTLEPALTLFTPRGGRVLYEIAMHGFPIYAVSFLLMGTSIFASSLFTALSDGLVSAIISFSRTLVFSRGDAAAPAADFAGNWHLAGCSGSRGARRDGFGVFSRQGTEKYQY